MGSLTLENLSQYHILSHPLIMRDSTFQEYQLIKCDREKYIIAQVCQVIILKAVLLQYADNGRHRFVCFSLH
jgi:hypothetical protein